MADGHKMLKGCAHDFLGRVDSTLEVGNRVARTYTECENVIDDRNRRSFGVFRGYGEWKYVPADSSHVFGCRGRGRSRRARLGAEGVGRSSGRPRPFWLPRISESEAKIVMQGIRRWYRSRWKKLMVAERRVRGLLCVMSASIPAHAEQLSSLMIVTRTSVGSMAIVLFVATRATHPLADRITSKLPNKERVQPKD